MSNLLAVVNVVIFGCLGGLAFCNWVMCRSQQWCWLKLAQAALGIYWCGLYAFLTFAPPEAYDTVWFGSVFVRPGMTLTGAVMLSAAIVGLRRSIPCKRKSKNSWDLN